LKRKTEKEFEQKQYLQVADTWSSVGYDSLNKSSMRKTSPKAKQHSEYSKVGVPDLEYFESNNEDSKSK
jgi:hypothetical protein